MRKKITVFGVFILSALAVGGLSSFLTRDGMKAYEAIPKSALTPPSFVFPIVWSALFILMGIGAALVYLAHSPYSRRALTVYWIQLAVNFFWSILFFNLRAYWAAFAWLILLWLLILAMTASFYRVSRTAAYLQIPYLLWVAFAGYLNFVIARLNTP